MTDKNSALYSHYIIDGVRFEMTPAELLDDCMEDSGFPDQSEFADIVDELTEPSLAPFEYKREKEQEYEKSNFTYSGNINAYHFSTFWYFGKGICDI